MGGASSDRDPVFKYVVLFAAFILLVLWMATFANVVRADDDVAEWTSFVAFAEDEGVAADPPLVSEGKKNRDKNKVVPPEPDDEPERPLVRPVNPTPRPDTKPVDPPKPPDTKPDANPRPDPGGNKVVPPDRHPGLPSFDLDELTKPVVEQIKEAIDGVLYRFYAALLVAVVALLLGIYVIVKVLK